MTRDLRLIGLGIALGLFLAWSMGCTAMLPMTDSVSTLPEDEVKRIAAITHLTEDQVRDPTIHEVHEVEVPCSEMLRLCYPGIPLFWKLLGALPLACTQIWQQPWNEKVAIIHYCWITDPLTMAHEREHAKGRLHSLW